MRREDYMEAVNRRINELLGLGYTINQYEQLQRNLLNAARSMKVDLKPESILRWLSQSYISEDQIDNLAHHLTVGETYFFREKLALELLTDKIIPAKLAQSNSAKKQLKIWSAGCSSGEEPYSVAIKLKESLSDQDNWDLKLLATDINTNALKKAEKGEYTPWSFRETPDNIKLRYFSNNGGKLQISNDIKKMVQFRKLNLATDEFLLSDESDDLKLDVIFCRNVLMYFTPEVIRRITKKFYNSLKTGGWLITGQVELNDLYFNSFQRVMFKGGIFYRKTSSDYKNEQPIKLFLSPDFAKSPDSASVLKKAKTQRSRFPGRAKHKKPLKSAKTELFVKKKISNLAVDKTDILYKKALNLADTGKLNEAEAIIKQLLETDGAGSDHFYLYAVILIEKGDWEKADANLVKALYLDPVHLPARLARSQVLKNMGMQMQANREMQNLIKDIDNYDDHDPLPGLEGITAGRLREMADLLKGEKV